MIALLARRALAIAAFASLLSCGIAPPKSAERQHIFDYTSHVFKINRAGYAEQIQGKAASLYKKVPYILYARKDEKIIFQQEATVPTTDTLIYSLGDGRYRLTRSMYLTAQNSNLFSFDRKTWHPVSELSFRIHAKTEAQSDSVLRVYYSAELAIAPELKSLKLNKRELHPNRAGDFIQLLKGRSLKKLQKKGLIKNWETSDPEIGVHIDLQKVILHFPKDMEFEYSFILLGNLIHSQTEGRELRMTFLRDIYFYYPNRLFAAVSFDGEYWGYNYFQFQIIPFARSIFTSPKSLSYSDGLYLND